MKDGLLLPNPARLARLWIVCQLLVSCCAFEPLSKRCRRVLPRPNACFATPTEQNDADRCPSRPSLDSRWLDVAPANIVPDSLRRSLLDGSVMASVLLSALPCRAAADTKPPAQGMLSTPQVADLLHAVPTFTLVDPKGVPYMVVGEDAKVTGYFFTEYKEAKRILDSARTSADKAIAESKKDPNQQNDLINPWKQARISTVPLDLAATLVTKSYSGNKNNYFQIAPSQANVQEALAITGKNELSEGKVPLFYYEDFVLTDTVNGTNVKRSPLYFGQAQLEQAYRKAHPGQSIPPVLVSELFAVVARMVTPGVQDDDLTTLVFVPPVDSLQKAKECQRKSGNEQAFVLGQRNVVL